MRADCAPTPHPHPPPPAGNPPINPAALCTKPTSIAAAGICDVSATHTAHLRCTARHVQAAHVYSACNGAGLPDTAAGCLQPSVLLPRSLL